MNYKLETIKTLKQARDTLVKAAAKREKLMSDISELEKRYSDGYIAKLTYEKELSEKQRELQILEDTKPAVDQVFAEYDKTINFLFLEDLKKSNPDLSNIQNVKLTQGEFEVLCRSTDNLVDLRMLNDYAQIHKLTPIKPSKDLESIRAEMQSVKFLMFDNAHSQGYHLERLKSDESFNQYLVNVYGSDNMGDADTEAKQEVSADMMLRDEIILDLADPNTSRLSLLSKAQGIQDNNIQIEVRNAINNG